MHPGPTRLVPYSRPKVSLHGKSQNRSVCQAERAPLNGNPTHTIVCLPYYVHGCGTAAIMQILRLADYPGRTKPDRGPLSTSLGKVERLICFFEHVRIYHKTLVSLFLFFSFLA